MLIQIRVANAHFDSKALNEERERQFHLCHNLLTDNDTLDKAGKITPSSLIILSGDLNLHSTSELEFITSHSFHDSLLITSMDPEIRSLTSSSMGLTFPKESKSPRRSDFVLSLVPSPWKCTQYSHMGTSPIKSQDNQSPLPCPKGKDGVLFPSDHLCVFTQFNLN
jgi:hypothetical protein